MQTAEDFNPLVGVPEDLGHGIRRVLAPNPSPMTFRGTNTYLIGTTDLAVIDPGPDDPAHLQAILRALRPEQNITHIFVTHAHLDHSPLAPVLAEKTGARVHAFGTASAGRSAVMTELADTGLMGGGEGVDQDFTPDITLTDGAVVSGKDWRLTAHWTPGHFGNHLCFAMDDIIFTGDLVMGWASSLVSPPDGDLTCFMASCARLLNMQACVLHAGHGAPVTNPKARLEWLMNHRRSREAEILKHLSKGPATASTLAKAIYTDTPTALIPAATRNVLAHLIDLKGKSLVDTRTALTAESVFENIGSCE
ncbi:Hydroxyacylglutathione hydrolase [Roseovarius litorisediminis]|uniref:Hydroxyacylglutathione hydrolase n=1 Tax=Roseovarius litorisediminis TaxID=1312363 RepID=A0A1Y5TLB7_9RHOB|nr:MBL fold metallo-hydrolase [Roseovarius litorisediminis]SLN66796.1 Hydroxyacylglutathione hydrolase [Roseovarius litorisediminis]